jgi:hypothetical protein
MFIPYLLDSSRNAGDFWHDYKFNYGGKFVKKSNIEEYRFTVSKKNKQLLGQASSLQDEGIEPCCKGEIMQFILVIS